MFCFCSLEVVGLSQGFVVVTQGRRAIDGSVSIPLRGTSGIPFCFVVKGFGVGGPARVALDSE